MENIEIEEKIKKENRKIILFVIIGIIEIVFVSFMYYQNWIEEKRDERKEYEKEIGNYNSQFLVYEGKQKGGQVKDLLKYIISNNQDYEDRQIQIAFVENGFEKVLNLSEIQKKISGLKMSQTYEITFEFNDRGYISLVCIEKDG